MNQEFTKALSLQKTGMPHQCVDLLGTCYRARSVFYHAPTMSRYLQINMLVDLMDDKHYVLMRDEGDHISATSYFLYEVPECPLYHLPAAAIIELFAAEGDPGSEVDTFELDLVSINGSAFIRSGSSREPKK